MQSQHLIKQTAQGWTITNLAAILLAKKLDAFSPALARKAPRVVIYEGINKLQTRNDTTGSRGYAVGFDGLVDFVHSAAPQNRFIEEVVREEVKMFPKQALRELIANALVHQDFLATGASVMIEMYSDVPKRDRYATALRYLIQASRPLRWSDLLMKIDPATNNSPT